MKKLMAMIGAVAMAFGLFADGPTPFAISYEANETAAGVVDGVWTPGSKWTWGDEEPIPVITDEQRVLPYETGSKARRDSVFMDVTGGTDNKSYANLSTGTNELGLAVDSGNVFLDQLVKFTGFDEPQTNLVAGTKIAVWMSEFDIDDDTTSTNLYITCGKNVNGTYEQVALAVNTNVNYKLDTWYRLTIKSVGDIFDGSVGSTARAGFLVWIDGEKVICEDAKTLLGADAAMITDSKKTAFYNAGRLFPSFTASDTLASVGYKGIGAIDDIIVDNEGPEFCVETVDVSFNKITGAVIAKVVDGDNVEFDYPEGSIAVKPGNLTVTLEAAAGYKMKPGAGTYVVDASTEGVKTVPVEEGDFVEVYATKNGTVEYGEDELYGMITSLVNGDVVVFNLDSTITNVVEEETVTFYSFPAGSAITVAVANDVTTWSVVVAGEGVYAYDYVGTSAGLIKNYTFEDENSSLVLNGNVAGEVSAATIYTTVAIEVSGKLTAAYLEPSDFITLSGSGKVITKDDELIGYFAAEEGTPEVVPGPEDGWFTYQIAGTFAVTVELDAENVEIESIVVDDQPVEKPYKGSYDVVESITVTYKPADGYKWVDDKETGIKTREEAGAIEAPDVELKTFTVTFLNEDDSEYAVSNDVPYNTAFDAVKPANPTKADYTFAGWIPAGEPVISNTTYKATFTLNTYAITWTSENVVATNNGEQVESGITLAKDATITFYPTVGSITNIVVDGVAVTVESPYTFTVQAKASVLKVLAGETAAPSPVPPEQGDVEITGSGESAVAKITPKTGVTTINVNPAMGFTGKYEIPSSVTKITGVEISQLIIKTGAYDIAPACKLVNGGEIALDDTKTVNEVPVKPTIGTGVAATDVKPADGAIAVKGIAGLYYALVRGDDPATVGTAGTVKDAKMATATGANVSLADETTKGAKGFYVIKVSIEAPAIVTED